MAVLARLIPFLRPHFGMFFGGLFGLVVVRAIEACIPQFLELGIDRIAAGSHELALPALGIVACVLVRFGLVSISRRAVRLSAIELASALRRALYAHVVRQGPGFFADYPTGDLMARAINDIAQVRQAVSGASRTLFALTFAGLFGFAFMIAESPRLALLLALPMPAIVLVAYLLARRIHARSLRVQRGFSALSDRVQQDFGGIRSIAAQCQEEREIERFTADSGAYTRDNERLLRTQSLLRLCLPLLAGLCELTIIYEGGSAVLAGELSLGTFTAFFFYLNMVLMPVFEAGNMVSQVQRAAAASERLFEIFDRTPEIADAAAHAAAPALRGGLSLEDVSFTHPRATAPALRGLSFAIEPGEMVAIVGRVGAGKSTLLRLLPRMLDPTHGCVRADGHDLRELPLARVRGQIALVPQDPFLFHKTFRENVAYDDPQRPAAQIARAVAIADLEPTVARIPEGLEALIGERGVTLSGGQRQRATLARGVIRDAPVLLLDDCFSSVDAETEERILARLREERRGRTTVLVSHRVSAVRRADRILVLDQGRLVEQGSHAELLARGGLYAALDRSQRQRDAHGAALRTPAGAPA